MHMILPTRNPTSSSCNLTNSKSYNINDKYLSINAVFLTAWYEYEEKNTRQISIINNISRTCLCSYVIRLRELADMQMLIRIENVEMLIGQADVQSL